MKTTFLQNREKAMVISWRQNGGGEGGMCPLKIVFYNTSTCSVWFKMHMHNSDDTCAPPKF